MSKLKGFTIIELMIVVVIIGILASTTLQVFSNYSCTSKGGHMINIPGTGHIVDYDGYLRKEYEKACRVQDSVIEYPQIEQNNNSNESFNPYQ